MPGRVIEHQQHLLARQVIPPPGRPGLQAGRDLPGADPGRQQQARQRVAGIDRPLTRGVRVQRQEQLPVREPLREPVRRVHRQGGLADPGHPADRADPHHPPARRRGRQVPQQPPELGAAAGEPGDITWQRPGDRRGGRRRDLLAQHRLLQAAQLLTRLDPQLLGQHLPGAAVGGQRIGLPLSPVQSQHQQPPQPLPHRILRHQLFQLPDHLPGQPPLNVGLEPSLHRHQPQLLQPGGLQRQRLHLSHIGQRPPAPQRQRLPEPARRNHRLPPAQRLPARPHQPLKPADVHPVGLDRDRVPAALRDQRSLWIQQRAEPRHIRAQRLARPRRRGPPPQHLGQILRRHHPAPSHHQQRQHRPLLRPAQPKLPAIADRPHRPQDPQLKHPNPHAPGAPNRAHMHRQPSTPALATSTNSSSRAKTRHTT